MSDPIKPVPVDVVVQVDDFVERRMADAAKYSNVQPLDDDGVFVLHRLAADIYAAGFDAGARAEFMRAGAAHRRVCSQAEARA